MASQSGDHAEPIDPSNLERIEVLKGPAPLLYGSNAVGGVVNLKASYTIPTQHLSHHLSVEVFNLGDTLYRNHLSFIKDLAPEIGRGVRFGYAVKLF